MKKFQQFVAIYILMLIPISSYSQILKFADNFDGANDTTSLKARNYLIYNRGTAPQGTAAVWFQGNSAFFNSYNGPPTGYLAADYNVVTGSGNIDSWLVLPALNIKAGDSISFYATSAFFTGLSFVDSIRVMYSSAGDSVPEANTWIELERFEVNQYSFWEKIALEIPNSSYNGRLAIRYCVVNAGPTGVNGNYIGIDQLEVVAGNKNIIAGNLFLDNNTNGIKDIGEIAVNGQKITETSTGRIAFSKLNGDYELLVLMSGNYTVSSPTNYFTTVPATQTANFTGINQLDSLNNFAFQPNGIFNDLAVIINPLSAARPGFNLTYAINVINFGSTAINGMLTFRPDTNIIYNTSTILPQVITNDSIVWNLGLINPLQTITIYITFNIPSSTPIGTLITATSEITPLIGDANGYNNFDYWSIPVTGSFDPNEVLVSRSFILASELPSAPLLDYIINFQNTGNDTAFNITVSNPISTMLDMNSFEFISSSSPVELGYNNLTREMKYYFKNILLPDSNINEPLSHGYLRYRIKPDTNLFPGNLIGNNAAIYFDFNSPVLTNTAFTKIVIRAAVIDLKQPNEIYIYPNPAANQFTIINEQLTNGKSATIKIMDVTGKLIYKATSINQKTDVNTKDFTPGIYFVQIQTPDFVETKKLVVAK